VVALGLLFITSVAMALRHRIHDAVKRGNVTDIEALLAGNPDLVNDKVR
jgi:hypothetical protein